MKYDRFVHIVIRDGFIKAVLTSSSEGRKTLRDMRENHMPTYKLTDDYKEYMKKCSEEHLKWRLEKWPVVKTMSPNLK
jgi:hypothetical protein